MVMRKGLWCLLVLYFCLPMEKEKDNRLDISVIKELMSAKFHIGFLLGEIKCCKWSWRVLMAT
jgi:hypothetical protein